MRLYLIRHAQSFNNALSLQSRDDETINFQTMRQADPVLTDIGYQQADALAQFLRDAPDDPITGELFNMTHMYCSPMHRTLLTAKPIAEQLEMQPEVWVDIHEIGGLFESDGEGNDTGVPGYTRQQIINEFGYAVPEGVTDDGWWDVEQGHETIENFLSRAVRVAFRLRQRANSDERIVLVSHGAFLDALVKALLNQSPMHPNDLFYAHYNAAITRFDFNGDGGWNSDRLRLHYLNRVDHLSHDLRTW